MWLEGIVISYAPIVLNKNKYLFLNVNMLEVCNFPSVIRILKLNGFEHRKLVSHIMGKSY